MRREVLACFRDERLEFKRFVNPEIGAVNSHPELGGDLSQCEGLEGEMILAIRIDISNFCVQVNVGEDVPEELVGDLMETHLDHADEAGN
jgi:hypothetical protein